MLKLAFGGDFGQSREGRCRTSGEEQRGTERIEAEETGVEKIRED